MTWKDDLYNSIRKSINEIVHVDDRHLLKLSNEDEFVICNHGCLDDASLCEHAIKPTSSQLQKLRKKRLQYVGTILKQMAIEYKNMGQAI